MHQAGTRADQSPFQPAIRGGQQRQRGGAGGGQRQRQPRHEALDLSLARQPRGMRNAAEQRVARKAPERACLGAQKA